MTDSPCSHSLSMEARVAVLEDIARNTEKLLAKMNARMDRMGFTRSRKERGFKEAVAFLKKSSAKNFGNLTAMLCSTAQHQGNLKFFCCFFFRKSSAYP